MQEGEKIRLPRGALAALKASDPALADVIAEVGPFRMRHRIATSDLESLVRAIVYQQLSTKAAATIFSRFSGLFDTRGFPTPEAILAVHYKKLQAAGLSRQKRAAVRDLCCHLRDGKLPLDRVAHMDDEDLIEHLSAVRGIGRWSAQMFLMFQLGRLDVWPEDDLGVRKALQRIRRRRELPDRRTMRKLGERYRPYRSVASWYLWRSLDGVAQL